MVHNKCLISIMCLMRANELTFDPDKTEALLVSWKAEDRTEIRPLPNWVLLPLKAQVRRLSEILDSSLSIDAQVLARSTLHI